MKVSHKGITRLSVVFAFVFWSLLLVVDLLILFGQSHNLKFDIPDFLPRAMIILFIFNLLIYYRYTIIKAESVNFLDLLWKVFVTGLLTTILSLIIRFVFNFLGSSALAKNIIIINFFYHLNIGLVLVFLISTFVAWKRLILYQKSKLLLNSFKAFEYALIGGLFFNLLGYGVFEIPFNIVFSILLIMALVLSFNLKWVAYLNFKQKWKSILFIVLVLIYLSYFFLNLVRYSDENTLVIDLISDVYVLALFAFIFIYSVIAVLVIVFNLPTSSVFEKKLEEVVSFQRLSQSIPSGKNEDQVYEILLDSSVSAVFADAAWIEILDKRSAIVKTNTFNVTEDKLESIKEQIRENELKQIFKSDFDLEHLPHRVTGSLKGTAFRSVLVYPVMAKTQHVATLVLLKEVSDGFDKEMAGIIETFVNQANISIENFRLLNEAIKNERYKEELKIANRVQKSLLPDKLINNDKIEISAFSKAADEVGGDYYDVFSFNSNKIAVVMGDVSGKGTSAAFNMSQMKGIFHSLVQLDLTPKEFMINANNALSRCLERSSFITLALYIIDFDKKVVQFSRAGHSPTLYYKAESKQAYFFETKGMGLGILRNNEFHKYVEVNEFKYHPSDVVVLYTDGITEATNTNKEEYGYPKLKESLEKYAEKTPEEICEGLVNDLYQFADEKTMDDDYSLLILKFK